MVKIKDIQFCMKNLEKKIKKDKNFLTFRSRDLNPRFSVIFPPMIWIFMEGEGDEIKSGQGSLNFSTLHRCLCWMLEILFYLILRYTIFFFYFSNKITFYLQARKWFPWFCHAFISKMHKPETGEQSVKYCTI